MPDSLTPVPATSLTLSRPRRIRGKAVDKRGRIVLRNDQVLIYAAPAGSRPAQVVAVTRTDSLGEFTADVPPGPFARAWGVVGAAPDEAIEILLADDKGLPAAVFLVAESIPASRQQAEHDACACEGALTPRLPEAEDLVRSDAYTQDIGSSCVNFTTPNRALEEHSYHVCVRTTDPQIGPLSLHELRAELRDLDQRIAEIRATIGSLKEAGKELAKEPAKETTKEPAKETTKDALPAASTAKKAAPTPIPSQAETLTTLLARLVAERAALVHQLTTARTPISALDAIAWEAEQPLHQATTLAHGHLLHIKQVWRADGYSMGDLVYSLPLAPGQKKRIAIFDWGRREQASRTEALTAEEALDATLQHDRDVSEIVDSVLHETIDASSTSKTKGTSFGFGLAGGAAAQGEYKGVQMAGMAGHGLGFSTGSGQSTSTASQDAARSLAASAVQNLRDVTMQSAAAVRTQRATVVEAIEQSEQVRVQTEFVGNYNHCHALTVQYFEVLRHLALHHELADVQECVFVPLLMRPFDAALALRFRAQLTGAFRAGDRGARARLERAYEGLDRNHRATVLHDTNAYATFPSARYADEAMIELSGSFALRLRLARPAEQFGPEVMSVPETVRSIAALTSPLDRALWQETLGWAAGWDALRTRVLTQPEAARDAVFQREAAAQHVIEALLRHVQVAAVSEAGVRTPIAVDLSIVSAQQLRAGAVAQEQRFQIALRARPGAALPPRAQVRSLELSLGVRPPAGSIAALDAVRVDYRTAHFAGPLHRGDAPSLAPSWSDLCERASVLFAAPLADAELRDVRREDAELATWLLAQLNRHLEEAHAAIWRALTPERRLMMLEGFHVEVPGRVDPATPTAPPPPPTQRSLASVVENRLLGVVGNCLVMPVAKGINLDPVFRWDNDLVEVDGRKVSRLLRHYMPEGGYRAAPFRVSVPTRGVFAEAVQGACNACEKKDETRFWRWEESPVPDSPTEIAAIDTSSRRAAPSDLTAKDLPAPIVSIQNAPAAPAPTGLGAAMGLLGTAGIFKDMTGLEGTQHLALQSLLANTDAAKHYVDKAVDIAKAAGALLRGQQIMDNIDEAFPGEGGSAKRSALKEELIRTQIGGGSVTGGGEQGEQQEGSQGEQSPFGGAFDSVISDAARRAAASARGSISMKVPGGGAIDIEHESAPGAAQAEDALQRLTRLSDETPDTALVVFSSVAIPDGSGGTRLAIVARLVPGRVFSDSGELAWSALPAQQSAYQANLKCVFWHPDENDYYLLPSTSALDDSTPDALRSLVADMNEVAQICRALFANGTSFVRTQLRGNAATSGHFFVDFLFTDAGGVWQAVPTPPPAVARQPLLPTVSKRMNGQSALANIYHPYDTGLRVTAALPAANSQILPTGGTTVTTVAALQPLAGTQSAMLLDGAGAFVATQLLDGNDAIDVLAFPGYTYTGANPPRVYASLGGARLMVDLRAMGPTTFGTPPAPLTTVNFGAVPPAQAINAAAAHTLVVARFMRGMQAGTGGALTPIAGQSWIEAFAVPLAAGTLAAGTLQAGRMNIVSLQLAFNPTTTQWTATGTVNGAAFTAGPLAVTQQVIA
jgi:hypothetical protein